MLAVDIDIEINMTLKFRPQFVLRFRGHDQYDEVREKAVSLNTSLNEYILSLIEKEEGLERATTQKVGEGASGGNASRSTRVKRDSSRQSARGGTEVKSPEVIPTGETQKAETSDDRGKPKHGDQADKTRRSIFGVGSDQSARPEGLSEPSGIEHSPRCTCAICREKRGKK